MGTAGRSLSVAVTASFYTIARHRPAGDGTPSTPFEAEGASTGAFRSAPMHPHNPGDIDRKSFAAYHRRYVVVF
jgi:hypothetical protein